MTLGVKKELGCLSLLAFSKFERQCPSLDGVKDYWLKS